MIRNGRRRPCQRWRKLAARAGVPSEVRLHDLRHTAASLLLASGTHAKVVADLLGHSTVSITLDTYSHVLPTLHEEAAGRMDELLSSGS